MSSHHLEFNNKLNVYNNDLK
uniref:Uncharacterized protein n=1 Tax=Anguilla anguilla TaxID=7936 RepID=A0A0E9Q421_ANGAN